MITKPGGSIIRIVSRGRTLTGRLTQKTLPWGNFKASHQKFVLPDGREVENTGITSVSFTNTGGQNVVYSEPQSIKLKLLLPSSMLVKEKYIDVYGIERTYLGVKGAGGVQDPITPVTTTSVKPKKPIHPRKPSRFPKPGLATIREED